MKNKKRNYTKRYIFFGLFTIVVLITITGLAINYFSKNVLKNPHLIKDNTSNNSKIFSDSTDGFSLEYPNSYTLEESTQEGNKLISFKKNEKLDSQGYILEKGSNIDLTYKRNLMLSPAYVKEENKYIIENPLFKNFRIENKSLNNAEALEFRYGTDYPLKASGISKFYLKNKNDVLEISLQIGVNTTKTEYESYLKDFDAIVNSVRFSK